MTEAGDGRREPAEKADLQADLQAVGRPDEKARSLMVGVVVERRPGVTRWARTQYRATALLPGAGPADGRVLAAEGAVEARHLASLPLTLHRADTEAYRVALAADPPKVWVVLRRAVRAEDWPRVHAVTASAYEAQDYIDPAEDIVDALPAPSGLVAWIEDFVARHHVETPFVKRRRDAAGLGDDGAGDAGAGEMGVGDPRVRQDRDVYRAPSSVRTGGRRSDEEEAS